MGMPPMMCHMPIMPMSLFEENRGIGATKLGIRRGAVRITKIEDVFAR
jgi:hypothetical protein